jgi:hypothetical protein
MPRKPLLPLAFVALAVAASACASSAAPPMSDAPNATVAQSEPATEPSAPVAGTDLDACEIVTAEDIATAVGIGAAEVGEGELEVSPTTLSPGHTECDYRGEYGGVIVSLTPEDGANLYDAARGSYDDASDREVAGADGAFWSENDGRGFFWKGAVTVMLQVGSFANGADRDEVVTALGQAALDKVD